MTSPPVEISSKAHFDGVLRSSRMVIADFYADWCGPCKQIAPLYASFSDSLSEPGRVTFVKINNDRHTDLARAYSVSSLPTFLVFRDGKVIHKTVGANPSELRELVQKLQTEIATLGAGSGGLWKGAEIPRGYSDITDQVEIRNCELLNADEDAGPVKILFDTSKPGGLDKDNSKKDFVQSGADDQLLLYMPFQGAIKLHTLQITSLPPSDQDDAPSRPTEIKLFINRPQNMGFNEADDSEPTQAMTLEEKDWNEQGTANIPLRYVKFQKTTSLIIYVEAGDGEAETVRLDRVKLIGEAGAKREMGTLEKVGDEPGE